jgi:hypothetical protein
VVFPIPFRRGKHEIATEAVGVGLEREIVSRFEKQACQAGIPRIFASPDEGWTAEFEFFLSTRQPNEPPASGNPVESILIPRTFAPCPAI